MRITFDPAKRDSTLRERGLDFADADAVFEGPGFTFQDIRHAYPEPAGRLVTLGLLAGRMVVLVWTPKGSDERRIISMRKANDREKTRFGQRLEQSRWP